METKLLQEACLRAIKMINPSENANIVSCVSFVGKYKASDGNFRLITVNVEMPKNQNTIKNLPSISRTKLKNQIQKSLNQ